MFTASVSRRELLILAILVTSLTVAAAWLYPIWDDARLLILINQNGNDAIRADLDSRVLLSAFLIFLSEHNLLLPVSLAFHWISWFGIGLATMRLWHLMFPSYAKFALLAAVLALAPVLCKVQFVIVSTVFIDVFSPLLAFAGILVLLSEPPAPGRRVVVYGAALFAILFSVIISEYGLATAIAGAVLLAAKWLRERHSGKSNSGILAAVVMTTAIGAYVLFSFLARFAASAAYRPEQALQSVASKMPLLPYRLLRGIWVGSFGGLFESLASVRVTSKVALVSLACGVIFSLFVIWGIRQKPQPENAERLEWFMVLTLFLASVVALLPFLLMGRSVQDKWDTRFLLPALPLLSAFTVYILLRVFGRRVWILVPALCGFLAGHATSSQFISTYLHPVPAFTSAPGIESASETTLGASANR